MNLIKKKLHKKKYNKFLSVQNKLIYEVPNLNYTFGTAIVPITGDIINEKGQ